MKFLGSLIDRFCASPLRVAYLFGFLALAAALAEVIDAKIALAETCESLNIEFP